MTVSTQKDWLAEMFVALKDCGEDISIVFGKYAPSRSDEVTPRWFTLPHDQFDGVSGLACLLAGEGVPVPPLPTLKDDRPTWLRRTRGFAAILRYLGVRRQAWTVEFDWQQDARCLPPGQRVAWRVFDVEQTQALVAAARAVGVTVNSLLLSHLDTAVQGQWVPDDQPRRWMIPVNLRGAVSKPEENVPHMSFFTVDVPGRSDVHKIHAIVDRCRRSGQHWGMWSLLHLGRLLGEEGMRRDIRKRERQRHGATGMFSNLGVWSTGDQNCWVFCPAITRVYPIGAGCITTNGRMALTVQLHEALGGTLDKAQTTLDAWVDGCLSSVRSSHGDLAGVPADQGSARSAVATAVNSM